MDITYCGPARPGVDITVGGSVRLAEFGKTIAVPKAVGVALVERGDFAIPQAPRRRRSHDSPPAGQEA